MSTLHAFYATSPEGECPHDTLRLACDFSVAVGERWYVECACGAAGPTADDDDEALVLWHELVDVLDFWRAGAVP